MDWNRIKLNLLRRRLPFTKSTPIFRGKHCWEFDGCRNPDGYGKIGLCDLEDGKKPHAKWTEYAHRAAAASWLGYDLNDEETIVAHDCENKRCFNPAHLAIKTQSQNVIEGRRWRGESRPLQPGEVDALRRYVKRHKHRANIAKFAASRGVSYSTCRKAIVGLLYNGPVSPQLLLPFSKMARPVALAKRTPFARIRNEVPF